MKHKFIFAISLAGILAGIATAIFFSIKTPALSPAFSPAVNPFRSAIYAEGIVESVQSSGENTNLYPEVAGTVKEIFVSEGQQIKAGDSLLRLDDSVQRATTEQLASQARAAKALLDELKAQPRKETLDVAAAQVTAAEASLKMAEDTYEKDLVAYRMDSRAVSKDTLDSAANAVKVSSTNLDVARKQYTLIKAGAWIYDIQNQERQTSALEESHTAANALLAKYTLRAPRDGVVLSINTVVGNYASPQGSYDTYTQGADPVIILGSSSAALNVRCYVDEILVPRLHLTSTVQAQMSIRGSDVKVPLHFVRVQPLVSPKIELSNQRQERVDVRVLPVIFTVAKPADVSLYAGELVDVYISE
jgi:HlyD family secretion protein